MPSERGHYLGELPMEHRFLDFTPIRKGQATLADLARDLAPTDLRILTNSMVDAMLQQLIECHDEDVTFIPFDPNANDPHAANPEEVHMPWTLGHVIVHTTASAEETAFLAAELARGVPNHGRSRYEVDWRTITTVGQCRQRLEESRRMRLASLDLWPDAPHLDLTYTPFPAAGPCNAVALLLVGLMHDDEHLGQITEIVRQARMRRTTSERPSHAA